MPAVDQDVLISSAAGMEWAHLLPRTADSEEERSRRRAQLDTLLRVKVTIHERVQDGAQQQAVSEVRAPQGQPGAQQAPAGQGWRSTVRSAGDDRRRRQRRRAQAADLQQQVRGGHSAPPLFGPGQGMSPAAEGLAGAAPTPLTAAGDGPTGEDGGEYFTPASTHMLPGPGRAARQPGHGSGSGSEGPSGPPSAQPSGVGSAPPSSGIPTAPSSGRHPDLGGGTRQPSRRRQLAAARGELAGGSARLPLSSGGGFGGEPSAAAEVQLPAFPPAPAALGQKQAAAQQPQRRRWKQQQHSNPLTRLLLRSAPPEQQQQGQDAVEASPAFQANRPTRFAVDPPSAPPPASLHPPAMQLVASQQQPEGAELNEMAALLFGRQPATQQQQAQAPPPAQRHQPHQAAPPPLQQATDSGAPCTAVKPGPSAGLDTTWSLPPTPSCIYALSPDASAAVGGEAACAGGRGGPPASTARGGLPAPALAAAETPAAAAAGEPLGSCLRQQPGGGAAEPTATALRLAPALGHVAETPQLFGSAGWQQPAAPGGEQGGAEAEPRRLFVAETPAEPAAAAAAEPGSGVVRRQQLRAQHSAAAVAAGAAGRPSEHQRQQEQGQGQWQQTPAAGSWQAAPQGAAAADRTPAPPAGPPAGLQLQLPQPVLQAVPCADGRHLALLLGSYAPAGEPTDVLVLRLPPGVVAAAAPSSPPDAALNQLGSGLAMVASVPVQRSRWAEGLELTPNCLQLAASERAGLLLILSAALELPEQPAPSQPAILVLPLPRCDADAAAAPPPQPAAGQRARRRPPPLAVEAGEPLTCVLLAGGGELLASGDGSGCVHRLLFDPLWRSYTWGRRLPPATYRAVQFEDVQQLQLYRCPSQGRALLAGLSSSGGVALWDVAGSRLLAARSHLAYALRSLQPITPQQAGLMAAAHPAPHQQDPAAGPAGGLVGGAAGPAGSGGAHLFVGLAQHRQSGEQCLAAVVLSGGALSISPGGLSSSGGPGQPPPGRVEPTAVAVAAGRCWLGTADGQLLGWSGGSGTTDGRSGGSGAVASLCAVPCGAAAEGAWGLVAGTAGGSCTLLAAPC